MSTHFPKPSHFVQQVGHPSSSAVAAQNLTSFLLWAHTPVGLTVCVVVLIALVGIFFMSSPRFSTRTGGRVLVRVQAPGTARTASAIPSVRGWSAALWVLPVLVVVLLIAVFGQ